MGSMKDKLGDKPFPENPGYEADSATSKQAADSMKGGAATLRETIFDLVLKAGPNGMTCDEVEETAGLSHQTASARIRELVMANRLRDSGRMRKTRSGRNAALWMVAP